MDMDCICDPGTIEGFTRGGTNGCEVKRVLRDRFADMALPSRIEWPELHMCLDRTSAFCAAIEFGEINTVFGAFRGFWGVCRKSLVVEAMFHLRSF